MSNVHVDISITAETWVNKSHVHGNCVTLNIDGVSFYCHDEAQLQAIVTELICARVMLVNLRAEQAQAAPTPVEPDRVAS